MRQSPKDPHLFRKHFDDTQSPSTQMITFTAGPADIGVQGGTFAPPPHISKLGSQGGGAYSALLLYCLHPHSFQNIPPSLDSIKEKAYIGYYCQFCMAVELIHNRLKKNLKDLSVFCAAVLPQLGSFKICFRVQLFTPIFASGVSSDQFLSNR